MSRNKPNWKQILAKAKLTGKKLEISHRLILAKALQELTGTDSEYAKSKIERLWETHVDGKLKTVADKI